MKIAILYICTGRYYIFWKTFYKSAEKYFLKDVEKHYFVFTDFEGKLVGESSGKITRIHQTKMGWPFDTLLRFQVFLKAETQLKAFDYIYFFNANMQFIQPVGQEIIPSSGNLLGVLHPGFYNKPRSEFPYDENPLSLACMGPHDGTHYFMGGLNGGTTKAYLDLIRVLDERISDDLQRGIIAKWHDESHINKYFWEKPPEILPSNYGAPEDWGSISDKKILVLNKSHPRFGGHDWLRGVSSKKVSKRRFFWKFIKDKVINLRKN